MTTEDRAREIHSTLTRGTSNKIPGHLSRRLASLLGEQHIKFSQHDLVGMSGTASGSVVVFTESVVVLAELTNSAVSAPSPDQRTVSLRIWPRAALAEISQPADDEMADDWVWGGVLNQPWPHDARVVLHYPDAKIRLPLTGPSYGSEAHDAFTDLLPSLLVDLAS